MVFDGVFTNLKVFRNLLVGIARNHSGYDLYLSRVSPNFFWRASSPEDAQGSEILHQIRDTFAPYPVITAITV